MALIDRWADFFRNRDNLLPTDPGVSIMEGYAKAWCKVVQKYPNFVGIPYYGRAFVSTVCPPLGFPDPVPPPENPPLTEGQCCDVFYRVRATVTRSFNGESQRDLPVDMRNVPGKITDIRVGRDENIGTLLYYLVYSTKCDGEEVVRSTTIGGKGFSGSEVRGNRSIVREDGLPDECYNPNERYPEDPPIDGIDFSPTINILRQDENKQPLPPVPVPVDIIKNTDLDLNIELNIGGDRYQFNYEGLDKIEPPAETDRYFPPELDNPEVIVSPPEEVEEDPVDEEVEEGQELLWVLVDVVKQPYKGKTLVFKNPEDNTYFAGYLSWVAPGETLYRMPELPIRKGKNAFKAPDGVKGYRILPVNGAKLSSRRYSIKLPVQ